MLFLFNIWCYVEFLVLCFQFYLIQAGFTISQSCVYLPIIAIMQEGGMGKKLFTEEAFEVILNPGEWKLVSSLVPPDHAPVRHAKHEQWRRNFQHNHFAREILFALEGTCCYSFCGRLYPCTPGTAFLFDANESHDLGYPPFADGLRHLWIYAMATDLVAHLIEVRSGKYQSVASFVLTGTSASLLLEETWTCLASNAAGTAPFRRIRIISALSSLLCRIIAESEDPPSLPARGGQQPELVETIKRHIAYAGGKGVSWDVLAHIAGCSKFHFARLFKEHAGQSIHSYINECRLHRMKELERAGASRKEISAELGFAHQSALSRWLKKGR